MEIELNRENEMEGVLVVESEGKSKSVAYGEIAQSPAHKFKLSLWQGEYKSRLVKIVRREGKRVSIHSEISQLLGIYYVFQGVIFAGVVQAIKVSCRDWWSPFSLSLITSMATILAVLHKLWIASLLEVEIAKEQSQAEAISKLMSCLKKEGADFDLNREVQPVDMPPHSILFYGHGVTLALIVFSIAILFSVVQILCNECPCD